MSSKGKLDNMLNMMRDYIRQETIEPVKFLFGSVFFLFLGSLFIAVGFVLISIGLVRFVQRFDNMGAWFSWVPYFSGSIFLILMAFFGFKVLITKKGRDV
jgi:hypothetical protein